MTYHAREIHVLCEIPCSKKRPTFLYQLHTVTFSVTYRATQVHFLCDIRCYANPFYVWHRSTDSVEIQFVCELWRYTSPVFVSHTMLYRSSFCVMYCAMLTRFCVQHASLYKSIFCLTYRAVQVHFLFDIPCCPDHFLCDIPCCPDPFSVWHTLLYRSIFCVTYSAREIDFLANIPSCRNTHFFCFHRSLLLNVNLLVIYRNVFFLYKICDQYPVFALFVLGGIDGSRQWSGDPP